MKLRVISTIKVKNKKKDLLQMEDKDLVFSIKDQTKRLGKNK